VEKHPFDPKLNRGFGRNEQSFQEHPSPGIAAEGNMQ
jgi:hypothetical protein